MLRALLAALVSTICAAAQAPTGAATASNSASGQVPGAIPRLDLSAALTRARTYGQQYLAASSAALLAREDRVQARAALLPTLNAFNQYIYTQGNGTPSGIFVANDGVHIYNEQAVVHADLFSVTRLADYRRTLAAEAAARARLEVAARGLTATVVQSYYALLTAQRHLENARRGVTEAQHFLDITRRQESGGEVAHADVVRAELQLQQRQRDRMDAETSELKARLALAVMLFPDINQKYEIVDDLESESRLQGLDQVRSEAYAYSPEMRYAQEGLRQAQFGVKSAKGAYWPSLAVDYFYGIDANVFGARGPEGRQNLGSVLQGTVNIPVWNWGATRSRVRQAEIQQRQSELDLMLTRRQLDADISGFYLEARAAGEQLESLRSSLALATESLRLTVLRYQGGEATALEVVDAQTTLIQARNAYADGLARYRIAIANLRNLTGRF